jgi:hypothetical protein
MRALIGGRSVTEVTPPVQLLVLGLSDRDAGHALADELARLRETAGVRVVDSLVVYKDAAGVVEVERAEGSAVAALVGLGGDRADPFVEDEGWDVLEDIPNDTAAALVLVEHAWAVPLHDAVERAGGFPISDGFVADEHTDTFTSRRVAQATRVSTVARADPPQHRTDR